MVIRTVELLVAVALTGVALSSCTKEEATVVDLDAPTSTSTSTTTVAAADSSVTVAPLTDDVDPDDPNAEARQQVIDAARQQCIDDPELAEGVVRLVVADTGEVANEYRVDCEEVRAEEQG